MWNSKVTVSHIVKSRIQSFCKSTANSVRVLRVTAGVAFPFKDSLVFEELTKLKRNSHVYKCVNYVSCVCRVFVPSGIQGQDDYEECVLSCELGICQDNNATQQDV